VRHFYFSQNILLIYNIDIWSANFIVKCIPFLYFILGTKTSVFYDGSGEFYNYVPNQYCMWDISIENGKKPSRLLSSTNQHLSLSWNRFELERWTEHCFNDYIRVWDSTCKDKTSSNLLYKTCGCGLLQLDARPAGGACSQDVESRMPTIITKGGNLCVEYVTNSMIQLNGIQGSVSVIDNVNDIKVRCRSHSNCNTCSSDPACGWCHSTSKCDAGNKLGDFNQGTSTCPAKMWSINDCSCRGTIEWNVRDTTPSGEAYEITDGSGMNKQYNNNMICKWKLYAPNQKSPGEVFLLKFKKFQLEYSDSCIFDSFKVEWIDHTGTKKERVLCQNGFGSLESIEITGVHDITKPIEITFQSDSESTFNGFIVEPKIEVQTKILLDTTWSGCTCDSDETWNYNGVVGKGCQDSGNGDGIAICKVVPGSCTSGDQWPPRGSILSWSSYERSCMFPFRYKGIWYHDCINIDNNNIPWCSSLPIFPAIPSPWDGYIKKISCQSTMKTDFYDTTQHLDYCSSWRTDSTGNYFNDFSGSVSENPTLELYDEPEEMVYSFDWSYGGAW
jgi:hypothetical protein